MMNQLNDLLHNPSGVTLDWGDHIGDRMFGPCREFGPISEVFLQIHCISL